MSTFSYHGGRILSNVELTAIYGRIRRVLPNGTLDIPTWIDSTVPGEQPISAVCSINDFLRDLVASPYLALLGQEYSTSGSPHIGFGSLKSSRLIELPFTQPANVPTTPINYTDVEAMIETSIQNGTIPKPTFNSCYIVFFADVLVRTPQGFTVGKDAGGFHSVFASQSGMNVTYCVIDAQDVGGTNTTFYASHEVVEAITNPDNGGLSLPTGWFDENYQEVADVCFKLDTDDPPPYHGFHVARFWAPSSKTCVLPPDVGPINPGPVIKISVKTTDECTAGIPGDADVIFSASASIGGTAVLINNGQWLAQGAALVGPTNLLSSTVQTPTAPGTFTLEFSCTDEFGCSLQGQKTFTCATAAQIDWVNKLCKVKHLVLHFWRFVDPLWDPLRDFVTHPIQASEIAKAEEMERAVTRLVSLLREEPRVETPGSIDIVNRE